MKERVVMAVDRSKGTGGGEMGIYDNQQQGNGSSYPDDMVIIRQPESPGGPCIVTVNCPDKTGLGCDLCRVILFFGLSIVKGDLSTDGKWCYIVFWVVGKGETRWGLLKRRLLEACPSVPGIYSYCFNQFEQPKQPEFFLLKFWCYDRLGLLHDVTDILCELELMIRRVKVSTTPDGKVVDLFFITDTRELLHTKKRKEDTYNQLKSVLGDSMIRCEIELARAEITTCLEASSSLHPTITEEMFSLEHHEEEPPRGSSRKPNSLSVTMDNTLSPAHTLIQICCQDQKGLLYDIMRTLKDYNIQISYGRFNGIQCRSCEIDLFVMQADGKKIIDPNKQKALCSRLKMELFRPFRIKLVKRGPDMELLVANPVELSGKGRPLVFYDITLVLKMLNTCIFLAEIGRHIIGDREWELYRILLDDGCASSVARSAIEDGVVKQLMGWD